MLRSLFLAGLAAAIPALAAEVAVGSSTLTVPDGWTAAVSQGTTTLIAPQKTPHIQLRALAIPAAEAHTKVATLVADQVKDFAAATTEAVTLGSLPAVRLTGTGTEADDGDPSNAEITLVTVGTTTVLVISHGEGKGAADRSPELARILATLH
jgi:hypothetical protein